MLSVAEDRRTAQRDERKTMEKWWEYETDDNQVGWIIEYN